MSSDGTAPKSHGAFGVRTCDIYYAVSEHDPLRMQLDLVGMRFVRLADGRTDAPSRVHATEFSQSASEHGLELTTLASGRLALVVRKVGASDGD